MKFNFNFWLIVAFFAVFSFSSCESDDEMDIRDAVVGNYTYSAEFYFLNENGSLELFDENEGLYEIKIGSANTLEIHEGGTRLLRTNSVEANGSNVIFDIPNQSIVLNGNTLNVEGYPNVGSDVNLIKDGIYNASEKTFDYGIKYTDTGDDFVILVFANKN